MNSLILYTSTNNPTRKKPKRKDATGAFIPESKRLATFLGKIFPGSTIVREPVRTFRVTQEKQRDQVETILQKYGDQGLEFKAVYFFCHGYKTGIQYGYKWKSGARRLASEIVANNPAVEMVTFYCCSVCNGRDNFAKWFFEYLEKNTEGREFQVFGHYTAGHTTMNEKIKIYLREFLPFIWSRNPIAEYNELVSPKQYRYLDKLMKKQKSDFRYAIPFVPRVLERFGFTENLKRS